MRIKRAIAIFLNIAAALFACTVILTNQDASSNTLLINGSTEYYLYWICPILCISSGILLYLRHDDWSIVLTLTALTIIHCYMVTYFSSSIHDDNGDPSLVAFTIIGPILVAVEGLALYIYLKMNRAWHRPYLSADPAPSVSIKGSGDEVVLIRYDCTVMSLYDKFATNRYRHKAAVGTVYVTNRRVLFSVEENARSIVSADVAGTRTQEISIKDISGIDYVVNTTSNKLYPIITMALVYIALYACVLFRINTESGAEFILKSTIPNVIVVFCIYWYMKLPIRSKAYFAVKTKAKRYGTYISSMSRGYCDDLEYHMEPTAEFEKMVSEIGAMILDIQRYGDNAISKWKTI